MPLSYYRDQVYPSFVGMTKQPLPFDKLKVNSGMTINIKSSSYTDD